MGSLHEPAAVLNLDVSTQHGAVERLKGFVEELRARRIPITDFEDFERQVCELIRAVEREVVAEGLAQHDVDVPVVLVDGVAHHRVVRCEQTYFTAAGPVRVERSRYRAPGTTQTVCPLELETGIVEERWTPRAAKQAAWAVAHLTPRESAEMFELVGGMTPSRSTLDRLPKQLGARWETDRRHLENTLREDEHVPDEAVTVAVSLDGVMVPMKDGQRAAKRAEARAVGKATRGPAGYREAACGTVSFYDEDGERLSTIRWGRMPEPGKATLKAMLSDELGRALAEHPELKLIKLADGARDNWAYFDTIPMGAEVVDFYHAADHLHTAFCLAYGESSTTGRAQYDKYRRILLEDVGGVQRVIRALCYLVDKHPRNKNLRDELRYFRNNRRRMRYPELRAENLPIASGVVEATCKTLVTARLKRSGMQWSEDGGQPILTLRSLAQSDRFHRAWKLLAATYKQTVEVPHNVVAMNSRRSVAVSG